MMVQVQRFLIHMKVTWMEFQALDFGLAYLLHSFWDLSVSLFYCAYQMNNEWMNLEKGRDPFYYITLVWWQKTKNWCNDIIYNAQILFKFWQVSLIENHHHHCHCHNHYHHHGQHGLRSNPGSFVSVSCWGEKVIFFLNLKDESRYTGKNMLGPWLSCLLCFDYNSVNTWESQFPTNALLSLL